MEETMSKVAGKFDEDADADAEGAWDAELASRMDDIKSGKAIGDPADQVFTELREKYA
jgi:hypothetical protein